LYGGNFSFLPSLPATTAIPGPAEGNFEERNVCTGVDAQDCARMANVLSVENAVQAEEIARLRGLLETHTPHENGGVYHEKILEPIDIVDQPPHGTLYCVAMAVLFSFQHISLGTNCLCLALESTAVADHFDSRHLTFIYFVLPI
jgi:hypothetical protein